MLSTNKSQIIPLKVNNLKGMSAIENIKLALLFWKLLPWHQIYDFGNEHPQSFSM